MHMYYSSTWLHLRLVVAELFLQSYARCLSRLEARLHSSSTRRVELRLARLRPDASERPASYVASDASIDFATRMPYVRNAIWLRCWNYQMQGACTMYVITSDSCGGQYAH